MELEVTGPGITRLRVPADVLGIGVLAVAASLLLFFLQGDVILGLADEGFLWYGAWRTSLGEVPVLDFESYDPGRYYWSGLWIRLFGDDLSMLRLSTAAFQALGVFFAMMILRRVYGSWAYILAGGIILCLWMYPRYKVFEPTIALAGVYFAIRMLDAPGLGRQFAAGVFLGLAAWFGRNHGLYGVIAFSIVQVMIFWKIDSVKPVERLLAFGAGVVIGYMPMLLMVAAIPGFLDTYLSRLMVEMARLGSTNLAREIPWPWVTWAQGVDLVGYAVTLRSSNFLIGLIYVLWPLAVLVAYLYLLARQKPLDGPSRALLAAAAFALPYYHYAVSRPDFQHVTMSIAPFLVLVMVVPTLWKGRLRSVQAILIFSALSVVTYYTVGKATYFYKKIHRGDLVEIEVKGDTMLLRPETASVIRALNRINTEYLGDNDSVAVLPFWPAAYVILDRVAPLWDTYLVHPRSESWQKGEIESMEGNLVKWAIIGDVAVDGREPLRMEHANPLIWRYFDENFEEIPIDDLPGNYRFLRRKDS
jgi:hypothetical protein